MEVGEVRGSPGTWLPTLHASSPARSGAGMGGLGAAALEGRPGADVSLARARKECAPGPRDSLFLPSAPSRKGRAAWFPAVPWGWGSGRTIELL